MLSEDPSSKALSIHKLKGKLKDSWACSAGYNLRVIFKFVEYFDENESISKNAILLETIGTHDEVY